MLEVQRKKVVRILYEFVSDELCRNMRQRSREEEGYAAEDFYDPIKRLE